MREKDRLIKVVKSPDNVPVGDKVMVAISKVVNAETNTLDTVDPV